jgi:xanthine dehydrogenase molybdenum-binding subunit
MDRIANDLGMDPLEFRLQRCSSTKSKRTLEIAAERIGWAAKWSPPSTKTGTKKRGIGMATFEHGYTGGYGEGPQSSAAVQLLDDGKALLMAGITDIGQGSRTTLTQIAAEVLGMKVEDITIASGDTNLPPDHPMGSSASRVAVTGGTAVHNAAQDLKNKVFDIVAPTLGTSPEDLDVDDGKIFSKTDPTQSMTWNKASIHVWGAVTGFVLGWGTNPSYGWGMAPLEDNVPFSTGMAEVEVDTETGEVTVLNWTCVYAIGQCLNRAIVETQLCGAFGVGIGYGLIEDIVYDPETGASLNAGHLNYRLPTIMDIPTLDVFPYEDEPNPVNAYGQRGVGEPGIFPVAPAINNAIYNAIGVSSNTNPVTPDKILKLLGKA